MVDNGPVYKFVVSMNSNAILYIKIHGKELPDEHPLYSKHPNFVISVGQVLALIHDIDLHCVCIDYLDTIYQSYAPNWSGLSLKNTNISGYSEGPMG